MRTTDLASTLAADLEREGHELIAAGHAKLAQAARQRAASPSSDPFDDWIALAKAPLARKTARRLARTGVIIAKKVAGRIYFSRASLDAYLRDAGPARPAEGQVETLLNVIAALSETAGRISTSIASE